MKLHYWIALIGTAALLRGEAVRTGLIRGVVLELALNEVSVRSDPGDVYKFRFDSRTWIERERERITGASLHTGEWLEVISDRGGYYARLIHVLDRTKPRPPVREGQFRLYRSHTDLAPKPVLMTYTGVVIDIKGGALTLRTKLDGIKTVYIRPDTRCLQTGEEVASSILLPQTRVFITAAMNSDDELEAFQIIWGNLLQPE